MAPSTLTPTAAAGSHADVFVCVYLRPCSCCLRQRWQHHYLSHLDDIKARRAARGGVAHLRKHHRHQHHHHHHTRRGSHAGAQADGHDSSSSSDDEDGDDEAYSKLAILTANSQYLPRLCVPARRSVCHPAVSEWLRAPVLHLHLSAMWRASGTTHTAPVDPTPIPTPAPHPTSTFRSYECLYRACPVFVIRKNRFVAALRSFAMANRQETDTDVVTRDAEYATVVRLAERVAAAFGVGVDEEMDWRAVLCSLRCVPIASCSQRPDSLSRCARLPPPPH